MERKEAIYILENGLNIHGNWSKALEMAIASLKTDEAYQLEYERTTKNDLGIDKTFYEQIVEYCNEHFLVLVEKDVWEDARKALTTKNDLGIDCISRADAIHAVSEALERTFVEHEDIANKLIGKLPPVTPQEPKSEWEYDHEILKAYSDGANEILDKIRAEMEQIKEAEYQIYGRGSWRFVDKCLNIIDKYKGESEG